MKIIVHRSKYVLAEPGLRLQNAAVHVSGDGRILSVGPWGHPDTSPGLDVEVIDWGSALIMPGLINAHTHLDLTHSQGRLTQFVNFTDWIMQLVNMRRSWSPEAFIDSAREGIHQSLASGTTMVGDITSNGLTCSAARGAMLRRVIFEEAIGLSPGQADASLSSLKDRLSVTNPEALFVHGISPHAPYSVSPELYRRMAALARQEGKLLETHVAETMAELQFLQTGTGDFRDFLNSRGILPPDWKAPGLDPISYLSSLGVLGPWCLLVHCNYLDRESIAMIRDSGSNVVYCPRSHHFFGHREHPVRNLLDAGVNVALGTDSLASNTSLSMLDEMRFLRKSRGDIKTDEIFRAATLNGAKALHFGDRLGRLRKDYWADMTILELPPNTRAQDLEDQILAGAGECIATIVQGLTAWTRPGRE
jgi:aminodeoxyfutalosine deaminase